MSHPLTIPLFLFSNIFYLNFWRSMKYFSLILSRQFTLTSISHKHKFLWWVFNTWKTSLIWLYSKEAPSDGSLIPTKKEEEVNGICAPFDWVQFMSSYLRQNELRQSWNFVIFLLYLFELEWMTDKVPLRKNISSIDS